MEEYGADPNIFALHVLQYLSLQLYESVSYAHNIRVIFLRGYLRIQDFLAFFMFPETLYSNKKLYLKVHKRENFFGSNFEFCTFYS